MWPEPVMNTIHMGFYGTELGKALAAVRTRAGKAFLPPMQMAVQVVFHQVLAWKKPSAAFKRTGMAAVCPMHQRMVLEHRLLPESSATTDYRAAPGLFFIMSKAVFSVACGAKKTFVATLLRAEIEPGFTLAGPACRCCIFVAQARQPRLESIGTGLTGITARAVAFLAP